ncbi:Ig-like domain-containing protein [Modestobacter sp. VKM Ac-2986]|uniref:DUF6923 family protein n=1 Tax=Modestobacter sp. VKM Ac-2986 TaxID=3004140 RepID=UPI0022AA9CB0|nr:Ig-like domain-containing protein [Modestobacter sp. VKM Ac-2986]MCZ2827266.1 Ig-like domain-containing protein [Modestobacter sp. VKM Ac-2986]
MSPRPSRAGRSSAAVGLLTVLLTSAAAVAPTVAAAPVTSPVPAFFMSQVRSGDSGSTLRVLAQDRYAHAGAGGVTVSDVGGESPYEYNAVGHRAADGHLYGIVRSGPSSDQLVRVGSGGEVTLLGPVDGLPATPGSDAYLSGTFGEGAYADTLIVKDNNGAGRLYLVDVADRVVTGSVAPSTTVRLFDFTWSAGHLWGGEVDGGTRSVVRLDVATGAVTRIPAGSVLPADDSGDYGAAWRYGNGNIALLSNGSGVITQVRIGGPTSASPTLTAVAHVQADPGGSNDGASTLATQPADLVLAAPTPGPVHPSSPVSWTVTVRNAGPGPSSGSTVTFAVPTGLTALQLPPGCTVPAGTVTCVVGPLVDGGSDDFTFTATSPAAGAVSVSAPIGVLGNEEDPTVSSALLVLTPDQVLTSSGVGTQEQTVLPGVPAGGAVTLLDGTTPVPTLDVPGGRYAVDDDALTFTPAYGWSGTAATARFRVTDGSGATGVGGYTATVQPPAPPAAPALTSSGTGTAPQQVVLPPAPDGGSRTLLDDDDAPVSRVVRPGQGTYDHDASSGTVTFTPVLGFQGPATPVRYRLTDAYGQSATGTDAPVVGRPAGPPAGAVLTSRDVGTTPQQVVLPAAPAGGSRTLLDGAGMPAAVVDVPGEGRYVLDPASGTVSFSPVLGFAAVGSVAYRSTDAYGSWSDGSYRPEVLRPEPPAPVAEATTGVGTAQQQTTSPTVPEGGVVTVLDGEGRPATSVTLPGQGTYRWDAPAGSAVFDPELGFHGAASPLTYRVTDAYGQSVDATWTPTVLAPAPPVAEPRTSTGVGSSVHTVLLPEAPVGGARTLVDVDGAPAATVVLPGRGTVELDPVTGSAVFRPAPGYDGTTVITYRLTDAYGQTADGHWSATVTAAAPPADAPLPPAPTPAPIPATSTRPTSTSPVVTSPTPGPATSSPPAPRAPASAAPASTPSAPTPPTLGAADEPTSAPVTPGSPELAWTGADLQVLAGQGVASVALGLVLLVAGRAPRTHPAGPAGRDRSPRGRHAAGGTSPRRRTTGGGRHAAGRAAVRRRSAGRVGGRPAES